MSREYSWSFPSRNSQPARKNLLNLWIYSPDARAFEGGKQRIADLEICLASGDSLLGDSGRGGGAAEELGEVRGFATFDKVPHREKTLDLHFTVDGQPQHLRFPNPGYRESLPDWKPVPLPQTWEKDGLAVTLNSIEAVLNRRHPVGYGEMWQKWSVKAKWTVTFNGKPADSWFDVSFSIEDAGGNRSSSFGFFGEPAWKLNCSVRQSYAFPFAPEDVEWYGTVDPKRVKSIAPGECELLPVTENVKRQTGTEFVGVFGVGEYQVLDGKVIKQNPPAEGSKAAFVNAVRDETSGIITLSVGRPAIYSIVDRNKRETDEFKEININSKGEPVYLGGQGSPVHLGGKNSPVSGELMIWRREASGNGPTIRFGIARFKETESFAFFVAPPALPTSDTKPPKVTETTSEWTSVRSSA